MPTAARRRFISAPPLAAAAAAVIAATKVNLYEDLLIYKAAGTSGPTPWHQDEPQWPVTGTQMASIWLCLEAVTPETGALRFVAGSHRGPLSEPYAPAAQRAGVEADRAYFTGGRLPDIDSAPERFPVISFATEPGDVIAFHPRIVHGAYGNATDRPRRTFSIRFLGDDVRWQSKASVVLPWLAEIGLGNGETISGERFPQVWPAQRSQSA
jgi:ectoine hydroxylase-related dioxygenase (phytanoyl-CoA dioxygenase family)